MAKTGKPKLAIHDCLLTYDDMVSRARQKAPAVFDMLDRIVDDPDASNRDKIAAGNTLLDRAYGKAGQKIEVTGENGGPIQNNFTVTFVRPGSGSKDS